MWSIAGTVWRLTGLRLRYCPRPDLHSEPSSAPIVAPSRLLSNCLGSDSPQHRLAGPPGHAAAQVCATLRLPLAASLKRAEISTQPIVRLRVLLSPL